MEKIDLHIHTNLSDGDLSINEIICIAKKNSCNKIAITDHEVIKDYSNVAKEKSIDIINGIEFNTSEKGVHILGYGIIDIPYVQREMNLLHQENELATFELIDRLAKLGFDISKEQVIEYLVSNGLEYDFLDKRHIVKYLINKGYTRDVPDTYNNLIGRGSKLYIPLKKISPEAIIELISNSGGVSILAHPCTIELSDKALFLKIKEMLNYGLDGIEVSNSKIRKEQEAKYRSIAERLNIIYTVGSDFHSPKFHNLGVECEETIYRNFTEKIKVKNSIIKN